MWAQEAILGVAAGCLLSCLLKNLTQSPLKPYPSHLPPIQGVTPTFLHRQHRVSLWCWWTGPSGVGALDRLGTSPRDPGPRKGGISRRPPRLATLRCAAKALPCMEEADTQGSGVAMC